MTPVVEVPGTFEISEKTKAKHQDANTHVCTYRGCHIRSASASSQIPVRVDNLSTALSEGLAARTFKASTAKTFFFCPKFSGPFHLEGQASVAHRIARQSTKRKKKGGFVLRHNRVSNKAIE